MHARVPGLILLHRRAASPTETANIGRMNITKDSAVTLTYKVTTPQGKPLDSRQPGLPARWL
jgi:FKBP-type peptidyl-prolyl cis-trans isomerase SlyD